MHATEPLLPRWPALPWEEWHDTANTLHMWTQIVGKVRLALTPMQQHWWNVPLYVSARGLTTSAMPVGEEYLDIEFDFVSHELHFRVSTGAIRSTPLSAQSVRDFYANFQESLAALGLNIPIHPVPVEIQNPIPFAEDTEHHSYDREAAHRFWRMLMSAERVFQKFSSAFVGKISPVHFFWGSFDLAVSRFSGRPAPPRTGADAITQEAYSEEVISAGFWPGNGGTASRPSIPTRCRNQPRFRKQAFGRLQLVLIRSWESFSSTMKPCVKRRIRTQHSWTFCNPPMKRARAFPVGTERLWSGPLVRAMRPASAPNCKAVSIGYGWPVPPAEPYTCPVA